MQNTNMEILKKVAKTLPVGYYLGRKIDVDFDEFSNESYFSPLEDKIKISLSMINNIIERDKITDIREFEMDLRCLLYHEISHVLLTPDNLYELCGHDELARNIMNIFEDTRIETILKHYYMAVDFEKFVKKVNNFKGEPAKSPLLLFYQVTRFNHGKQALLDFKNKIIDKYKIISKISNKNMIYEYTKEVFELYSMCKMEFQNQPQSQQNQPQNQPQSQPQEQPQSQQNQPQNQPQNQEESKDLIDIDDLKQMIKDIFKKMSYKDEDDGLYCKLKDIVAKRKGKGNQSGGTLNYSGKKFNMKAYIKPNTDYKWFEKNNTNGKIQNQSPIKINLYIDNSGSFKYHENKINQILVTLKKIEKEVANLEITLTTINSYVIERKLEKNYVFKCMGGTSFTDNIDSIVRKNNSTRNQRINIVLFDGRVHNSNKFELFNDNKSIIIYEKENRTSVEHYASKSIKIFIDNDEYTERLTQAICDGLYRVLG